LIIATDFRRGFFSQIDELFDETFLLGPGCPEVLRPLAAHVIGDLVHNIKDALSMAQLLRIAQIFAVFLYDMRLPIATQVISVRILLSLLDRAAMLKSVSNAYNCSTNALVTS
jgi:transformation/transcription domain-associated protein